MRVKELMSTPVVTAQPEESAQSAARTLARYGIGALPVLGRDGKVCGIVTDRDLVIRCMAAGRDPAKTGVGEIMTGRVCSVSPELTVAAAAHLMGREQLRRLPVTCRGKLCGMLSLGDLAGGSIADAGDALWDRELDLLYRPGGK